MAELNDMFTVLTDFPGALIYFMVTVGATLMALLTAGRAYQTTRAKKTRRVMIGISVVLGLQLILLALHIPGWLGNSGLSISLPVIHRALNLLAFIWLIWTLLSQRPKAWHDILAVSLSLCTIILTVLAILFWFRLFSNGGFNGNWLDLIWQGFALLLITLTIIALALQKSSYKFEGFAIVAVAALGHILHILAPNNGDFPAFVLLSQILYYPLMISITWQHANLAFINQNNGFAKSMDDPTEGRRDVSPRLAASLLDISLQNTSKKIHHAISHTISLFMMMDICVILHLDNQNNEISFESAYDLIREDYLRNFTLTEQQAPCLYNAFLDGKLLEIKGSDQTRLEIESLHRATGYNQLGNITFYPLRYNGRAITSGLLFMTPYTFRKWQAESNERLEILAPTLARIFDYANEIEGRNSAMEAVQVTLNQKNRENTRLQEQYDRSQALLSELRQEFNTAKTDHMAEIQIWVERQKLLENQIQALEAQITQSRAALDEVQIMQAEKLALEEKLSKATLQTQRLRGALVKAKTYIENIVTSQNGFSNEDAMQTDSTTTPSQNTEKTGASKDTTSLIHLPALIEQIRQKFEDAYSQKNISLRIDQSDCPENVILLQAPLEKIINGLLENALKASPNGDQVEIKISLDESLKPQSMLCIQVTDRGGGLSVQEQNTLFAMIDRVGHPTPGGIGDMAALREVIKAVGVLQGQIWVKSDVAKPTTFRVTLPIAPLDAT